LAFPGAGRAQDAQPASSDVAVQQPASSSSQNFLELRERIAQLRQRSQQLGVRMGLSYESDAVLLDTRTELDALASELQTISGNFRPRLSAINERLTEIGSAQDGEPVALTQERQGLNTEKAEINTLVGEVDGLSTIIASQLTETAAMRRALFSN